ncbi:helix-turn-helix transcriptional regulator [Pseudolactococcus yaeyamensis]
MFQERLKSLRLEQKLTQKQIAEKLGISQQSYAQWENGKRKPSGETLQKLADFFDVSVDSLLGNTDERVSQLDISLDKALDKSVAYEGNELSDSDRNAIKDLIKEYLANKGQ